MNPSTNVDEPVRPGPAGAFGALGDPMRLAILRRLGDGPRCVCDLEADLRTAQSLLSYHLRILREAGLVAATRRGRRTDYRLQPARLRDALRELRALVPRRGPS